MSQPNPKHVALRALLKQARDLWDKQDFAGARRTLDGLATEAAAAGLTSPYVDWLMGCTLDYLDEEERALAHLERALATDPLYLDAERSIEVVLSNARRSLQSRDLPPESPRVALLYGLLHQRDAADRNAHVVFARHQIATGQLTEARAQVEAMIRLYYPAADLYALLAIIAERQGDHEAALRASAEVERLGGVAETEHVLATTNTLDGPNARTTETRPS